MAERTRTADALHTFLKEHQKLTRRIAELRKWWSELDALGTRKFGEMAFRIEELRDFLAEHFEEEERDGYLASVLELAPHLTAQASVLCRQHRLFLSRLDDLIARVRCPEPPATLWRSARDEIAQFVSDLRQHEQAENAIVQGAFEDDVGASD